MQKIRNYTLKIRFTAPPDGSSHFVPGAGNKIIVNKPPI
jgi:hypothetical protein